MATLRLAARFDQIAKRREANEEIANACRYWAHRLQRCGENIVGWRCGSSGLCPRCAVRAAKRYRMRVERSFLSTSMPLAFVTLTAPHDDLGAGLSCLTRTFGRFRRRRAWVSAFDDGIAFIEFGLTWSGRPTWNVHLHCVVALRGSLPKSHVMGQAWRECLAASGVTGRADVQRVIRRAVRHRRARG